MEDKVSEPLMPMFVKYLQLNWKNLQRQLQPDLLTWAEVGKTEKMEFIQHTLLIFRWDNDI